MAEQATERMVVSAAPARCFEVSSDIEAYPEWASDIKEVTIESRDDQGRPELVTFRAAAFGRSTSYTLAYDYSEAPQVLSWVQTRGDITSKLDGRYVFTPDGDATWLLTEWAQTRISPSDFATSPRGAGARLREPARAGCRARLARITPQARSPFRAHAHDCSLRRARP